jgi:hypothetical protein
MVRSKQTHIPLTSKWHLAEVLDLVGDLERLQGNPERSAQLHRETLRLHRDLGDEVGMALDFHHLGKLALMSGRHVRAAQLFAAARALRSTRVSTAEAPPADSKHDVATIRVELGEEAFAAAWAAGSSMTTDQAMDMALSDRD